MSQIAARGILCVEDDPDDRLLAEMAHRESGVVNPLEFVSGGEEALEYLRRTGRYATRVGEDQPGIILLDLNMPATDGRETLAIVKADPALRRIPVVILTTSSARRDIAASYDQGANSYIVKPAAFPGLVRLFERLCDYWFEIGSLPPEAGT
jgi:two-component system response regulator